MDNQDLSQKKRNIVGVVTFCILTVIGLIILIYSAV